MPGTLGNAGERVGRVVAVPAWQVRSNLGLNRR